MVQQEIEVSNVLGIHARPAALIVQLSNKFASDIWLEKDGAKADAKSIMSVMMLAAAYQSKILVCAKGKEEDQAVDAIVSLFKSNFNEE
jgi:phosphocarrier protein